MDIGDMYSKFMKSRQHVSSEYNRGAKDFAEFLMLEEKRRPTKRAADLPVCTCEDMPLFGGEECPIHDN